MRGHLYLRQPLAAEGDELLGQLGPRGPAHGCTTAFDLLAELLVRDAEDRDVGDGGMA